MNDEEARRIRVDFDSDGLRLEHWWVKIDRGEFELQRNCTFLGVDCLDLWMLAYVRSYFQSYLRGKMGSMKTQKNALGVEHEGYLQFTLSVKDGEKFLRVTKFLGETTLEQRDLDYQQVVMLDIVIGKVLASYEFRKKPSPR